MSSCSYQQAIIEAVRQWQTRLLQLDRRSGLLYFPMGKRGVTLRGIGPDALLERLAASRVGLAFLYAERVRTARNLFNVVEDTEAEEPQIRVRPGDLDTDLAPLELQKGLLALNRRHREWQEEQGLNVLFIALGFLHWVDEDEEPACSPVLLIPCDLTHASPRDPFLLIGDESEDLVVNPTLRHKLETMAGIELPDIGETTVEGYLATVASLVADHEGWCVEPAIVVATFPFSKLAMWEDLDLMISTGVTHPLVRRLAGDVDACIADRSGGQSAIPTEDARLQGARLDDLLDIRDQYAVVDADFSQLRAIELARSGANLVIHGPPGTGKSQTIANIIATLIAEGRRVLFVSEKTAALDVVKRRLAKVGLGGFCLDLHSDRGKKDSVYAQLREALGQPPADPQEFPYERLLARRQELNAIVRALHEIRRPLGLTVFAVHGRVAAIHDVPRLNIVVDDVSALNDNRLRRIDEAARRIARRAPQFRDHYTSRWRSLGPVSTSPMLTHEVRADLALIRSAVDSVLDTAASASAACGVDAPETQFEATQLLRVLAHLKSIPGTIPPPWLEPGGLARALVSTDALRSEAAERQELFAVLLSSLSGVPTELRFREWLGAALADAAEAPRWERMAGSEWSKDLLADPPTRAAEWRAIANALDALLEASIHLQTLLGVEHCLDSRTAAESAVAVSERLLKIGKVPAPWSSARSGC